MNFEEYASLWGYEYVFENAHTSERDNEAMLDLVSRNLRFNHQLRNGPIQCRCRRPYRCGDEWCPNRMANYECLSCTDCDNQQLSRPGNHVPPVTIDDNPGFGLSLFATRRLQAREYIGELKGQYITHPPGHDNPRSLYSIQLVTEESKADDRIFTIDMSRYANEFRFATHNCEANMETFLVKVGAEVRVGVKASREIQQGDLLTLNYGKGFFQHGLICFCDTCCEGGGLAGERARELAEARQEARVSRGRRRQTLQSDNNQSSIQEGNGEHDGGLIRRGRSRPLIVSVNQRGGNSAGRGGRSGVGRGGRSNAVRGGRNNAVRGGRSSVGRGRKSSEGRGGRNSVGHGGISSRVARGKGRGSRSRRAVSGGRNSVPNGRERSNGRGRSKRGRVEGRGGRSRAAAAMSTIRDAQHDTGRGRGRRRVRFAS